MKKLSKQSGKGPLPDSLFGSDFLVTFELVPARASKGKAVDQILAFAKDAASGGIISALSITDNAGGHPALSPTSLGTEIKSMGIEPIIHFSCKDKNRNIIESQLFELDRSGLKSLLVLTGDYPRYGYKGNAKPVFDLDSVQVLGLLEEMRKGMVVDPRAPGGGVRLSALDFNAGCVVSPFKRLQAELIPQYLKLKKKIAAGARFVITQMGFDVRKYHELRLFMDQESLDRPLIGTVFVPNLGLARLLNRGVVPGCVLPDRLLRRIEDEVAGSGDMGLDARLKRAGRLIAILRGIGYQGVHISGPEISHSHVEWMIDYAREIGDNWPEYVPEFLFPEEWQYWYFAEDPATGLNRVPESCKSIDSRIPDTASLKEFVSPGLWLGLLAHWMFFEPGKGAYHRVNTAVAGIEGRLAEEILSSFEYLCKELLYDCRRCGDCFLAETAFLCPQSKCAKYLVNGPCGGSRDGWCEVWPGRRRCIYVRIFERLKMLKGVDSLKESIVPPRNWALSETSSWLNFHLGRDHHKLKK